MAPPKKAFRNRGIDIAAWENDRGISFTFRKTYKDKTSGEYKETKYLFADDLKCLRDLLVEVIAWNSSLADREVHEAEAANSGAEARARSITQDDIPF